jgi:hypothetical protein
MTDDPIAAARGCWLGFLIGLVILGACLGSLWIAARVIW